MVGLTALSLLMLVNVRAPVELTVNVKDGATIGGIVNFRVMVTAKNTIRDVEFYVGENLRGTDNSTPYEFRIDTLEEPEGAVKVKFVAYTTENEKGEKTLTLSVDNQLSKGGAFHVDRGEEMLRQSKFDDAILAGRTALRAQKGFVPAMDLLARAYFGKGVLDAAQKWAEDALAAQPGDPAALDLLAGINLKKAFNTMNRAGTSPEETLNTIKSSLASAVEARRKAAEQAFDAMGQPNDANRIKYADQALRIGRYSSAVNALRASFDKTPEDNGLTNRIVYAHLRSGRIRDAQSVLEMHKKFGPLDAYGNALMAIVYQLQGSTEQSDEAIKEAILSDSEDLGVQTAQAFLAIFRGRTTVLAQLATQLAKDQGQKPEVLYYLSALYYPLRRFEESRQAFERAALANPMSYDLYIERANQAIANAASNPTFSTDQATNNKQLLYSINLAEAYFDTALKCKGDSFEALAGLALTAMFRNQAGDAVKYATASVRANPNYAAGQYVLAAAYGQAKMRPEAQAAIDAAGKIERSLGGQPTPRAIEAWRYFWSKGRMPLITPPRG